MKSKVTYEDKRVRNPRPTWEEYDNLVEEYALFRQRMKILEEHNEELKQRIKELENER